MLTLDKTKLLGFKIINDHLDDQDPIISAKIGQTVMLNLDLPENLTPAAIQAGQTGGNILDFLNNPPNNNTGSSSGSSNFTNNFSLINSKYNKYTNYANSNFFYNNDQLGKNFWLHVLFGTGSFDKQSFNNSVTYDSFGVAAGSDIYKFRNKRKLGVFGAYTITDSKNKHLSQTFSDSKFYQLGVYGSEKINKKFKLSAVFSMGWDDYTTSRNTNTGIAIGDFKAGGYFGDLELTYNQKNKFYNNLLTTTPFARLEGWSVDRDGYTEIGPGGLRIKSETTNKLASVFGARVHTKYKANNVESNPTFRLAWAHQFLDKTPGLITRSAYLAGVAPLGKEPTVNRDSLRVNAGSTFKIKQFKDSIVFYVNYRGDLYSDAKLHTFSTGVKFELA